MGALTWSATLHRPMSVVVCRAGGASVLSEFGTVQMELKTLSYHTGNIIYDKKATKIMNVIRRHMPPDGMTPTYMNPTTGKHLWCVSMCLLVCVWFGPKWPQALSTGGSSAGLPTATSCSYCCLALFWCSQIISL